MDKVLDEYIVKRRTSRWKQAIFYKMIAVTGLACCFIYSEPNARLTEKDQRRKILKELANMLCMPSIKAHSSNRMVMRNHFLGGAVEMVLERQIVTLQKMLLSLVLQSWTYSDRWQLLCLPRPEEELTKNQEKRSDLREACVQ